MSLKKITFSVIVLDILMLLLASASTRAFERNPGRISFGLSQTTVISPMPTATVIPLQTEEKRVQTGVVVLSAFIVDNGRKWPYEGIFSLCRPNMLLDSSSGSDYLPPDDITMDMDCYQIKTSKAGHGMLRLPPGFYKMGLPFNQCLPGQYCLMQDNNTQVIYPEIWTYNSTGFYLKPATVVRVIALRPDNFPN